MRTILALGLLTLPLTADEPKHDGQPLSYWKSQLQDAKVDARQYAADAFVQMERAMAKGAVAELAAALKDEDARVRWSSAQALGRLGVDAAPAVPELIAALEMRTGPEFTDFREYAYRALGAIGPKAKEAVPLLIKRLGTDDDRSYRIVNALGRIGPDARAALPRLFKRVNDEPILLNDIGTAIVAIDPEGKEVPALIRRMVRIELTRKCATHPTLCEQFTTRFPELALKYTIPLLSDEEALVRKQAARVLTLLGPLAASAKDSLLKAIGDPEAEVRVAVLDALFKTAPGAFRPAVPVLAKLIAANGKVPTENIAMLAAHEKEITPLLMKELGTTKTNEYTALVAALAQLRVTSQPLLIAALDDPSAAVRCQASVVLMTLGNVAPESLPKLIRLLKDPDADVRLRAVGAIIHVDLERKQIAEWLPTIESLVRDQKHPSIQMEAVGMLESLGKLARSAAPTLKLALRDADGDLKAYMALTLVALDRSAGIAGLPTLLKAIGDPNSKRRMKAIEMVGRLGPAAKDAIPALRKILATPTEYGYFRLESATALGRIDRSEIPAGLTVALEMLKADRPDCERPDVVAAIAEWGTDAKSAAPALRKIVDEKDVQVPERVPALIALVLIGSDEDGSARVAIQAIIKEAKRPRDRITLIQSLQRLGPVAKPLADEVRPLANDRVVGRRVKTMLAEVDGVAAN